MKLLSVLFAVLDLSPIQGVSADQAHLKAIVNAILSIMGAITALILVITGFRYIFSQGNPNEIATLRNSIVYSVIGIVVIMAAFAFVNFVVSGTR
jgi:hypothetical protein